MPRQQTRLNDKDFELLKKERMSVLGETGALSPPFGNDVEDFVKFHVYDMNDTYLKSGMSEDFENDGDNIKLKPGNDLRKVGFTRGDYKVKYLFYRRMAGADEVVLTKSVGDESGIVHSGNPQLTGEPMGLFYVDEDGKVFEGEKPPADGSPPSELDVKEYKFFIDDISSDRKEVRLAPQAINLDKYKDEFSSLSDEYGIYTPVRGFGSFMMGGGLNGLGKFGGIDSTAFQFDTKAGSDAGFKQKYIDGTLEVENAFVIGYTEHTNTNENGNWSLEDPIPVITIESNYPDGNATMGTPVIFTAKRENGNVAPSQLSYYWDFGCDHQEFGGPEITHTYTITGNMNVSVVINSPNFVDTVTLDNPLSIPYPLDDTYLPASPDDTASPTPSPGSSALDGKIIKWDGVTTTGTPQSAPGQATTTNTRFYVQSGHRRWITSGYNLGLLRELRGLDEESDVSLYTGLMNTLPIGPHIDGLTITGAPSPTTSDTGLNEPITDGYLLGSVGDTGGDDDDDDDSGDDDSGTQDTYYTLSVDVKYNSTSFGNGYTPVSLPTTIYHENGPDDEIDAYIKIDGINVGRSYSESYLEGESVDIEIVDDSYPENSYGFAGWVGSGTSYDGTRTEVMSGNVNLTAQIKILM